MSNQTRIQPGVREGGQYATGARTEPEVALASPPGFQDVMDGLDGRDKELADILLDPTGDRDTGQRQNGYALLGGFGGYGGYDFEYEVDWVSESLREHYHRSGEDPPTLVVERDEGGEGQAYTVAAHLEDNAHVSTFHSIDDAISDQEATGFDAALDIARNLDSQFAQAIARREKLTEPDAGFSRAELDHIAGAPARDGYPVPVRPEFMPEPDDIVWEPSGDSIEVTLYLPGGSAVSAWSHSDQFDTTLDESYDLIQLRPEFLAEVSGHERSEREKQAASHLRDLHHRIEASHRQAAEFTRSKVHSHILSAALGEK